MTYQIDNDADIERLLFTCCICGNRFIGHGNNPEPLQSITNRCCDRCADEYVLPARIRQIMQEDTRKEV